MEMVPLRPDAGLGDVVERINANTTAIFEGILALQEVADSYSKALPASLEDREHLHAQADALARDLAAVAKTASALAARQPRLATATAPAVTTVIGTVSTDVTLTWAAPWPDNTYSVLPSLEAPPSLLGKVGVAVKSKAPEKVVLTVMTSAALASGTVTVRAISVA